MTCESFDARLDALLDGRCSNEEWQEAEAHLAGCPRCRQLFEAMSGRADDLDDESHDALTAAVLAKTSGGGRACASARERICDLVDGTLGPFDRELVEAHLAHCGECSALASVVAEQTRVLDAFVNLAPRRPLTDSVLALTSCRRAEPGVLDRVRTWLSRAAQRPRFSIEVAYALTVLLLVVLGNPVDAFKDASVRVQPGVTAVATAVGRPLAGMREAGAARLVDVERTVAPVLAAESLPAKAESLIVAWVTEPVRLIAERVWSWAAPVIDAFRRAFSVTTTEPGAGRGR